MAKSSWENVEGNKDGEGSGACHPLQRGLVGSFA